MFAEIIYDDVCETYYKKPYNTNIIYIYTYYYYYYTRTNKIGTLFT